MNIRRVEPKEGDVALVAPLFDAYRQFYGLEPDPKRAREFLSERLHHRESVIFVAVAGDHGLEQAIGFVQLYPTFSSVAARRLWVVNDLFVVPEGRGKGVGRTLMDRARRHADETGACRLTLETKRDNQVAKALYRSLGYVLDEDVEHYTLELK